MLYSNKTKGKEVLYMLNKTDIETLLAEYEQIYTKCNNTKLKYFWKGAIFALKIILKKG